MARASENLGKPRVIILFPSEIIEIREKNNRFCTNSLTFLLIDMNYKWGDIITTFIINKNRKNCGKNRNWLIDWNVEAD